jgi:RND family efflux transporter MFP subunit
MDSSSYIASGRGYFDRTRKYVLTHRIRSFILAIIVIVAVYWLWGVTHPTVTQTRYVLSTVQTGTIVSTVSESGQVSPSNEVTINPQASGQVTEVLVKDGEQVAQGQALAYLNATDEYNAVTSAKASLESAQLSLQKLQEPATALELTQDQNAVTKAQSTLVTDQTNLTNDYSTAYSDVVSTYLDLPSIQTQLQDIVTGTEASKGAQWNIDYYENATTNWDNMDSLSGRSSTYDAYTAANAAYATAYADFQLTSQSSATSTDQSILDETYTTLQSEQNALNAINSYIQFYENQVKNHNQSPSSEADSSITTLSADISKINSHLSALLNDKNQITAGQQSIINDNAAIVESQETLQQLQAGPDALDVQSDELNIQEQQNALQQAEDNLSEYTITAPFAGTIANLDLNVGDTVGSGTAAATLITSADIVDISVNEVDAAKIALGQQATLTFDAIPNLSLTGSVVDVSPLGTVTQGVVSYAIKIGFTTQDPRVKAGMTVNADIQSAVHQNVLIVPASAITTVGGTTYVSVFNPPLTGSGVTSTSGIVSATPPTQVPVTIGITDNTNTEIDSGLTAGEQIVARTISSGSSKTAAAAATARSGFGGGAGGAAAVRI